MDDWVSLEDMNLSTVELPESEVDANGNRWGLAAFGYRPMSRPRYG